MANLSKLVLSVLLGLGLTVFMHASTAGSSSSLLDMSTEGFNNVGRVDFNEPATTLTSTRTTKPTTTPTVTTPLTTVTTASGPTSFPDVVCLKNLSHVDGHELCFQYVDALANVTYTGTVNSSLQTIFHVTNFKGDSPLTLNARSDDPALQSHPVMIVTRIGSSQDSFQLPYHVESQDGWSSYSSVRRTLCPQRADPQFSQTSEKLETKPSHGTKLELNFATTSKANVSFVFTVNQAANFNASIKGNFTLSVTPSESQMFYFELPETSEEFLLSAASPSNSCSIISLHQHCESAARASSNPEPSRGTRMTMSERAGIMIPRSNFPGGVYVLFRSFPDDSLCSVNSSSKSLGSRSKTIHFHIEELATAEQRTVVFFAYTLGGLVAIAVILGVVSSVIIGLTSGKFIRQFVVHEEDEDESLINCGESEKGDELSFQEPKKPNYTIQIFVIALFYAMPVGRLVYTNMQVMATTGNEDICYYNSLCTLSYFSLRSFNHIFSNVGYILLGLLLMAIVAFKEKQCRKSHESSSPVQLTGIPVRFGFFYAMAMGLIVQGVFSGFYHVCPTRDSFEFDTAFMYVLATVCILHLYHARNRGTSVGADSTFVVLGVVILHTSLTFFHDLTYFKAYFAIAHFLGYNIVATEFYYKGNMQWKIRPALLKNHLKTFWRTRPLHLDRLVVVILGNAAILVLSNVEWLTPLFNFNTYILLMFVTSLLLYSTYYVVMKYQHKESILKPSFPIFYLLLSVVVWITALVLFNRKVTTWEGTPAESRASDQHCIVAGIYDTHDLWHFVSAFGLFFFFQFLLFLDDDRAAVPVHEIPVF